MNNLKKVSFVFTIFILLFSLQGCGKPSPKNHNLDDQSLSLQGWGDGVKKLDGQIVKTADGRFFTIHHNIGDTYFLRPVDISKVKMTADFIEKERSQ